MDDFADKVLGHVARPDYQPITAKVLARRLEIPPDDYGEFRRAIKRLIREGKLDVAKDKTLRRPADATRAPGTIVGTFRRTSKGFGFVRPQGVRDGRDQDIYIPAEDAGDASTGDEVAVKV